MSFGFEGPSVKDLPSGAKVVIYSLNKARIHSYVAPETSFGDATHIIETENYLVLIDAQYTIPNAKEFRSYADSLNKVIAGIVISHAHPDHYFGLSVAFQDIPSYALKEVRDKISASGEAMIKESKQSLGDLIPDKVMIPSQVLREGTVEIDGLKYVYTKYTNSEADNQVVIELPDIGVIIVQDMVYNRYHPWIEDPSNISNWIKNLERLKGLERSPGKKYKIVLSGHGNPGSPSTYDSMIRYLTYTDQVFKKYKTSEEVKDKLLSAYSYKSGAPIIDMYLKYIFHSN